MLHRRLALAALATTLALTLVRCGTAANTTADSGTKKDSGTTAHDSGTVIDDAGTTPDDAGGNPGGCGTISALRTDSTCLNTNVTISGAVVLGSRLSSTTKAEMFIQDPAGGPNSGIMVFFPLTAAGGTALARGDVVSVVGTLTQYNNDLEIGGATMTISVTSSGATLPAPVTVSNGAELAPASTAHDDAIAQRVQLTGTSSVIDPAPAELARWGKVDGGYAIKGYNGVKIDNGVLVVDTYTYKDGTCPLEPTDGGAALVTSFNNLTGVWGWAKDTSTDAGTYYRVIEPMNCGEMQGQ